MPSFAGLTKFFGRTASEGAAFAAGLAVSPALSPVVREVVNEANATYSTHPLSAGEAAAVVAEDVEQYDFGKAEASFNGLNEDRFKALLGEVLNAPGVGELFQAYRRDLITDAMFEHGLRKAKLETMWDEPLKALKDQRLDPAVIATAIQRGIMTDPGFLPVGPPTTEGAVKAFPTSPLDPLAEAQAAGIDEARLFVETAIVGLPLSLQQAASAYFRGIIERVDFERAVAEGNTRNEWGDAALEQARQILTAHDYIEGRLRNWIDDQAMLAGTAKHGMSAEDTALLFKVTGRPISFHQVFIGLRRGGVYDGPTAELEPAFLKSLQESNIRPEWYNLAWAQRYTYPSAFVLRNLTQKGEITQEDARTILLYEGWEPTLADKVSAAWAGGTTTTQLVSTKGANTRALNAIGKSYTTLKRTKAEAEAELTQLGVDQAEWPAFFNAWDVTREATVVGLSNAQLKRAYAKSVLTLDEALARLEANGLSAADAQTYLSS